MVVKICKVIGFLVSWWGLLRLRPSKTFLSKKSWVLSGKPCNLQWLEIPAIYVLIALAENFCSDRYDTKLTKSV